MTSNNIELLEQIVTPYRKTIFIKCACGTEGIEVSADNTDDWGGQQTFYISLWSYGRDTKLSFRQRLSRAWGVLIGKEKDPDEIILQEGEAYQLREFISRHLADRDLIETLLKDNERLNEILMKYQVSSEYDMGYEHAQESLLQCVKEYFVDVIQGNERRGHSRLSSLLDGYLNKLKNS